MDNKSFISKLLKGFVVMSVHVTYRIKRKKDCSHSGLLLSWQIRAIQKPWFSKKPSTPQTRWLCRAEKKKVYRAQFLLLWKSWSEWSWKMGCYASGSSSSSLQLLYLSSREPIRRQNEPSYPLVIPPGVSQGNPSKVWWHLNCLGSLVIHEVAMS